MAETKCVICHDPLFNGTSTIALPCGDSLMHTFHATCLNNWAERGAETCPLCRASLVGMEIQMQLHQPVPVLAPAHTPWYKTKKGKIAIVAGVIAILVGGILLAAWLSGALAAGTAATAVGSSAAGEAAGIAVGAPMVGSDVGLKGVLATATVVFASILK